MRTNQTYLLVDDPVCLFVFFLIRNPDLNHFLGFFGGRGGPTQSEAGVPWSQQGEWSQAMALVTCGLFL